MSKRSNFLLILLFPLLSWGQEYSEVIPIVRVSPIYPEEQLNTKQEGWVKMQFDVTPVGRVENIVIIDSYPEKVFDQAAINALLKFKFKPRVVDGKAVSAKVSQTIEFDLPGVNSIDTSQIELPDKPLNYELKYQKIKKVYHSSVVVRDSKTGNYIKEINLHKSKGQEPFLAQSENSPYLFYYFRKNKKQGQVNVYSAVDFNLLHEVITEPLYFTLYESKNNFFYQINANQVDLLAMMSNNKKPKLISINGETGISEIKYEFEKNTLLKGTADMKYLWARKVSTDPTTSARFNKTTKNSLKFIRTDNFEIFREIKLQEKLVSVQYWNDIIQLMFEYSNKEPRYRVIFLNMATNEYFDDFYSSKKPIIYSVDGPYKSLMIAGVSSGHGENKHIKLAQFKHNKLIDLSNEDFYVEYNEVNYKHDDTGFYMYVFGNQSFGLFNVLNPNDTFKIDVPMNVANGFFNSTADVVYLNEKKGSKIALLDIEKKKLINVVKTGSTEKKVGQAFASILTMALTAPTGYMVTPLGGFRSSSTKMFVSIGDKRLFVINYKTNDVTSFDAKDLSDKYIVDTGKGTFQIIQAHFEKDLPVVVISMKKVTFLDPETGRMIKQLSYDKPLNITEDHQLSYLKDDMVKTISLAYID